MRAFNNKLLKRRFNLFQSVMTMSVIFWKVAGNNNIPTYKHFIFVQDNILYITLALDLLSRKA